MSELYEIVKVSSKFKFFYSFSFKLITKTSGAAYKSVKAKDSLVLSLV